MDKVSAWLTLHHAPSVGPVTFRKALDYFGSPESVLESGRALLSKSGIFKREALDFLAQTESKRAQLIEKDLRWLEGDDAHILFLGSEDYPQLLMEISDPPSLLFVRGNPDALLLPQLAVVGSRNPDVVGKEIARDFARKLARAGLTITSGMALGIDAEAHRGALDGGKTVAVTGTGLDRVYPARNRDLAHEIVQQGAIVSEFAIGTEPRPENFPRRNRIISGLSIGTLVVQAARKSGSLITARMSMEQGREVFAIPGSIHNPLARGSHLLIRQGAKLVETTEDIIEELGGMLNLLREQLVEHSSSEGGSTREESDPEVEQVLNAISYETVLVDQVVEFCGLTTEVVSSIIMRLEIKGEVATAPGGRVMRLQK
ncbi:MAG: DNA-protecting protein DprA [Gammaproteobacteria bacterium]|uniref:DNA-protecting protein DprA n=1 Tax=Candidatus Thiopontia autotrophica TaxID=2841688 RepID=A0A8J6TXI0_9GAMM|nr:DNA-protecting protein DprA [Candidatus Thiopontia autotrophica]MBL6968788.1 DNA-protecting protein DprA [Gammaproteobacteria bacterium]